MSDNSKKSKRYSIIVENNLKMYTKQQSSLVMDSRTNSISKDSSFVNSDDGSAKEIVSMLDKIRGPMTPRDPRKTIDGSLFFTVKLNDD